MYSNDTPSRHAARRLPAESETAARSKGSRNDCVGSEGAVAGKQKAAPTASSEVAVQVAYGAGQWELGTLRQGRNPLCEVN